MEEYYPQPLEYHPERWLRDDRADMGTTCKTDGGFLSLPFSHGLRACPGKRFAEQSLYLAVATVSNASSAISSDGIGWFCNVGFSPPLSPNVSAVLHETLMLLLPF